MLFAIPDLLLLDEPTNYLDIEGTVWLEAHIKTYPGTAFIVSHDRDFLNAAVTHIAHLRGGKLFSYTGNYDAFETKMAEQQRLSMSMRGKQDAERRHLESFVERFRYSASKAKQAQSRIKRLEKMQPVATIINDPIPPIDLPSPEKGLSPPIVRFDDASLGYEEGINILNDINLNIDNEDRIGILGKNGEGKSTFAKGVLGHLQAQSGHIRRHKKLKIGYFAQHEVDALNMSHSALDHIVELMPTATEAQRRARLARFGLGRNQSDTIAGDLSGGEKARLLFSLISFHAPHLLVLDEPTNHLDMDSRNELTKALNTYQGAVLLISHDRNLLETVVDRLWVVEDGNISTFDGNLDDYRRLQLEKHRTSSGKKSSKKTKGKDRRAGADARNSVAPLKKKVAAFEADIEKTRNQVEKIDKQLTISDLFTNNYDKAVQLSKKRAKYLSQLECLESNWLKAVDTYEKAVKDM